MQMIFTPSRSHPKPLPYITTLGIGLCLLTLLASTASGEPPLRLDGSFLVKVTRSRRAPGKAASARNPGVESAALVERGEPPLARLKASRSGWFWQPLGGGTSPAARSEPAPDRQDQPRPRTTAEAAAPAASGTARVDAGEAYWIVASPAEVRSPQPRTDLPAPDSSSGEARAFSGPDTDRPSNEPTARLLVKPSNTPWDDAHENLSRQILTSGVPSLRSALDNEGLEIKAIEPNLLIEPVERDSGTAPTAVLSDDLAKGWPTRAPFDWHLDATGLRQARDRVHSLPDSGGRVRVAMLDTGYDPDHVTLPVHFRRDLSTRFLLNGREDPSGRGRSDKSGHGTATLAILAGAPVRLNGGPPVLIGAAPDAEILQIRVCDEVVLFGVASLSSGLNRAVDLGADVVSISLGGAPSNAWADAVNRAYESGTAVVAASGNCLVTPFFGFLSTPARTVYPAAFSRVLSVPGATASNQSYRRMPLPGGLWPGNWGGILMRGNIGPRWDMTEAVAAFTPNIPWAVYQKADGHQHEGISRSGAGTSAATPQVAAAAALWLQMHRREVGEANWRTWRKTEAVYQALFKSADLKHGRLYSAAGEMPPVGRYFGNRILRADRALDIGVPPKMQKRWPANAGLNWLWLLSPVDPTGGRERALDREEQVRLEMYRLEAAQLTSKSVRLQRILGEVDPNSEEPPASVKKRFAAALAEDPTASNKLKEAILRKKDF